MKITVRNYRRIKSADLEFSGIALVCGRNEAGKTSLAQAVQSALTGEPLTAAEDLEGRRTRKAARELVHEGETRGSCTVEDANGETQMLWPKCEHTTKGNPPLSSPLAAGVGNLVSMDPTERIRSLKGVIGGEPTLDDLTADMKGRDIGPDVVKTVWGRIQELGWDGALEQAQKKGAEKKGAYREATGEAYGSKKAAQWRPTGWAEAWEGRKLDDFEHHAQTAAKRVEELMSAEAKAGVSRETLQQQVAGIEALTKSIAANQKQLGLHRAALEAIEAEGGELAVPDALAIEACPHCDEPVAIVRRPGSWDGKDIKPMLAAPPEGMTAAAMKEIRLQVASLDGKARTLTAEISTLEVQVRDWRRALDDAKKAEEQLVGMGAEQVSPEYAEARKAQDQANAELDMARRHFRGQALHRTIMLNAEIQKSLGDGGVRATVLGAALAKTNASLAQVCQTAGIPVLVINQDGTISCGGRPYRDLSGSLQLRMRAILQLAVAKLSKSAMMVIDVEDATDRLHLTHLLQTLTRVKMPALVVAHAEAPQLAPNIETDKARELGLVGSSYWVEDGVVLPLREKVDG